MGIIKQGILGGFKGKVGNVIGTSWKGRAVMKAMPLSVANPRTALQVTQRSKFGEVTKVASDLLGGTIAMLDNPFAGSMSGYNRFVKRNVSKVSNSGKMNYHLLTISEGSLGAAAAPTAVGFLLNGTQATFDLIHTASPFNLDDDKIIVAVWNDTQGVWANRGTAVGVRSSATVAVNFSRAVANGDDLQVIVSAIRNDKKYVSTSTNTYHTAVL